MTRAEFKQWLKEDITLDGSLQIKLNDQTYDRIIDRELKTMYEINPDAQMETYFVLPMKIFYTEEFRKTRIIKFPECVLSIVKLEEMKQRNSMFGIMDPDFGFNKAFQADLWLGSLMNMDSVAFRTIQWSAWDQMKQFTLVNMQYEWNFPTRQLYVKGHDPKTNVFCGLYVKTPESELFDNSWVQQWIAAHMKLQANKVMTLFSTQLIGGVTINMQSYVEEANKDIEDCKKYWLDVSHVPNMYTI